jgi:hypothetical protein
MPIIELRILPPLAVGRLGAASDPLEAFDLVVDPERPLDYRRIVPQTTLVVDEETGAITSSYVPTTIRFKDDARRIRPVAPFLEVFARTSEAPDELVPLDLALLAREGLGVDAVSWRVEVGNIKLYRRTNDTNDQIHACVDALTSHRRQALAGTCPNFVDGRTLPLGWVQFVKPTDAYPQIRLRFTPAGGHVYGSALERHTSPTQVERDPIIDDEALILYDDKKGTWRGYRESVGPTLTNPAQIYAGYADGEYQVSWGYLDDECDGYARVMLALGDGSMLTAQAHIGAGPPAFAPDTLPVRVVSDELEQILYGPSYDDDTPVPIEEAEELVRRALETVRLMNTAVMNGNTLNGRQNIASTMVRQDTNDFERYYEPIAATSIVDNLALRALHERVFSALSAGSAPWFSEVLRRPEEIGDLSDTARRKMPALMRGADGRGLCLTRRHIDMVIKAATQAMFRGGGYATPAVVHPERKP